MENKKDICKRYLAYNKSVRVIVTDTTKMVQELRDIHSCSNVVTAALGRTLTATVIMGSMLTDEDRITIQIKGDGEIGSMVVCSNSKLETKAYAANPQVEIPLKENGKLDVSTAVGKGYLNIVKDIGLKDPYIGQVELISSEIAEDFAYYFVTSEQRPCAVALGVLIGKDNKVQKACGYMIEPLPDCSEKVLDVIESINSNISSVTNLLTDMGEIDELAKFITADENIESIYEEEPLLLCDCNKERIDKAIIALGKEDSLSTLHANNEVLEVSCHFCNKEYKYDEKQIEELFNN